MRLNTVERRGEGKNGAAWHVSGERERSMALATAQRRGGESGARCINDALLGYSIGLVARVHKFVYKSHRSSSEVTARINFALAATPLSDAPEATGRRTTRAPKCARARARERKHCREPPSPPMFISLKIILGWYRCSIIPNLYAFKFIFNFDDWCLLTYLLYL